MEQKKSKSAKPLTRKSNNPAYVKICTQVYIEMKESSFSLQNYLAFVEESLIFLANNANYYGITTQDVFDLIDKPMAVMMFNAHKAMKIYREEWQRRIIQRKEERLGNQANNTVS